MIYIKIELKNSKYKIFLNKNQYNNLIENGNIKYKLTDLKKRVNTQLGDGIASLIQMALPFVKSVAPKVLGTLGLSSLGAIASSAINKKMNKDHIIKISDKQLDDINNKCWSHIAPFSRLYLVKVVVQLKSQR